MPYLFGGSFLVNVLRRDELGGYVILIYFRFVFILFF